MLPGRSGIFTTAVKRGVAPHTSKQRVLAAISKLRSAFFTGYKKNNCTYYIYIMIIYDSQLNRPESWFNRQKKKTLSMRVGSLVLRPFNARGARWERDKGLVPVIRACVEFYWNPGKIVFFGIF